MHFLNQSLIHGHDHHLSCLTAGSFKKSYLVEIKVRLINKMVKGLHHVEFRIFISQLCERIWLKQLLYVDLNHFGIYYIYILEIDRNDLDYVRPYSKCLSIFDKFSKFWKSRMIVFFRYWSLKLNWTRKRCHVRQNSLQKPQIVFKSN